RRRRFSAAPFTPQSSGRSCGSFYRCWAGGSGSISRRRIRCAVMYKQRLNLCVYLVLAAAGGCLTRLAYLQIVCRDASRAQMIRPEVYRPISLPTVRGSIQDRQGRTLAYDSPAFYLHINYRLSRLLDDRFWETTIQSELGKEKTRDQV